MTVIVELEKAISSELKKFELRFFNLVITENEINVIVMSRVAEYVNDLFRNLFSGYNIKCIVEYRGYVKRKDLFQGDNTTVSIKYDEKEFKNGFKQNYVEYPLVLPKTRKYPKKFTVRSPCKDCGSHHRFRVDCAQYCANCNEMKPILTVSQIKKVKRLM